MEKITIETTIHQSLNRVWDAYNLPDHVVHWNFASDDWYCPKATNEFLVGGKFNYRMEAKDGSVGFDFVGIYDDIIIHEKMAYHMEDGRQVIVLFQKQNSDTHVRVIFDSEDENPIELQKMGWQSILDQFKKYSESLSNR